MGKGVKIGRLRFGTPAQGVKAAIDSKDPLRNIISFVYSTTPGAVTFINVAPVATLSLINSGAYLNKIYAGFRANTVAGGAALAPTYFALQISGGIAPNNSLASSSFAGTGSLQNNLTFVSNQGFIDVNFIKPAPITGTAISILLFAAWTAALGATDTVTLNCFIDTIE